MPAELKTPGPNRKGVVIMSKEFQGTVVQVQGPVIDVQFSPNKLPSIRDALWLEADGRRRVMEVAQHVGQDTVRCFMLSPNPFAGGAH